MALFCPTRRLGSANGIRIPCNTPRPKPPGPGWRLVYASSALVKLPTPQPIRITQATPSRIPGQRLRARPAPGFDIESDAGSIPEEHVFSPPSAARKNVRIGEQVL